MQLSDEERAAILAAFSSKYTESKNMAEVKDGKKTTEFALATVIAAITTFGDKLGIFDDSFLEGQPDLMLIFRCVQMLALATIVVAYIWGRSVTKSSNGV